MSISQSQQGGRPVSYGACKLQEESKSDAVPFVIIPDLVREEKCLEEFELILSPHNRFRLFCCPQLEFDGQPLSNLDRHQPVQLLSIPPSFFSLPQSFES